MSCKNVALRNFIGLSTEKKRKVLSWRNHDEVRKWMYTRRIITEESHFEFILDLKKDENNGYFFISNRDRDLGVIALNDIADEWKTANLGIYANPGLKGCGSFLMEAIFYLGFEVLNLQIIRAEVFEKNKNAIALYKRNGFLRDRVLKEHVMIHEKWIDVVIGRINNTKTQPK